MMESEKRTRKSRIGPKLKDAGWKIAPFSSSEPLSWYQETGIEEHQTNKGPADYGLCADRIQR